MGTNVIVHGKDSTEVLQNDSTKAQTSEVFVTNNALNTYLASLIAGERNPGTSNEYLAANPESNYAIVTADTDVSASLPATLYGVTVIVATATSVIEIRDSLTAGGGTVVLSIPAATAIGTYYECNGIKLITGLYADFTGTGTLRLDWRET